MNRVVKKLVASALAAAPLAAMVPQTAHAAKVVTAPPACSAALVNASACSGYYAGNLLGGSRAKIGEQIAGVASLDANYTFDGNWSRVDATKITSLTGGNMLDFGSMLYGETIIGIHFGNVAGAGGNVTGFYLFDFGTQGANGITLNNVQGFSNAVLYTTGAAGAVPEPSTWALMLIAFGAMGAAMRARTERTRSLASAV